MSAEPAFVVGRTRTRGRAHALPAEGWTCGGPGGMRAVGCGVVCAHRTESTFEPHNGHSCYRCSREVRRRIRDHKRLLADGLGVR
jgi:hypothetical protein